MGGGGVVFILGHSDFVAGAYTRMVTRARARVAFFPSQIQLGADLSKCAPGCNATIFARTLIVTRG